MRLAAMDAAPPVRACASMRWRVARLQLNTGIVVGRNPDEDSRAGPAQTIGRLAPILQRLPGDFEQQSLLWIDSARLSRRYAEKIRVERVDLLEKASPTRVKLAGLPRIWIEQRVEVEAIGGHFRDRVDPIAQEFPELVRRMGPAWKATAHADDGYIHRVRLSTTTADSRARR